MGGILNIFFGYNFNAFLLMLHLKIACKKSKVISAYKVLSILILVDYLHQILVNGNGWKSVSFGVKTAMCGFFGAPL